MKIQFKKNKDNSYYTIMEVRKCCDYLSFNNGELKAGDGFRVEYFNGDGLVFAADDGAYYVSPLNFCPYCGKEIEAEIIT